MTWYRRFRRANPIPPARRGQVSSQGRTDLRAILPRDPVSDEVITAAFARPPLRRRWLIGGAAALVAVVVLGAAGLVIWGGGPGATPSPAARVTPAPSSPAAAPTPAPRPTPSPRPSPSPSPSASATPFTPTCEAAPQDFLDAVFALSGGGPGSAGAAVVVPVGDGTVPGEQWWLGAVQYGVVPVGQADLALGDRAAWLTNRWSPVQPDGAKLIPVGADDWGNVTWDAAQLARGQAALAEAWACLDRATAGRTPSPAAPEYTFTCEQAPAAVVDQVEAWTGQRYDNLPMVEVGEGLQVGERWWIVAGRLTNVPSPQQPSGPLWIKIADDPDHPPTVDDAAWSDVSWTGEQLARAKAAYAAWLACL
ncbi:MAG: hypothetical protein LBR33_08210 [Propionibacteriaceae bacterium]|jgi:hypothetical protein|nr:hypothetical protein [Propionibacteriaceae bacterium]